LVRFASASSSRHPEKNQPFSQAQDDNMLRRGSFSSIFSSSSLSALQAAGAAAHSRGLLHFWSASSPSSSAPPVFSFTVPTAAALWVAQRPASRKPSISRKSAPRPTPLSLPYDQQVVVDPIQHVCVSNKATIDELMRLLDGDQPRIFLRAPPASGKTVLARQLVSRLKASNRRVAMPRMEDNDTADAVKKKFVDAIALVTPPGETASQDFSNVVRNFFTHRGVIVVDEAHLLWRFAADLQPLFKPDDDCLSRICAVSAASECQPLRDGEPSLTPPNDFARFYWHPALPDYNDFKEQCERANLMLSVDAVRFVWQLGAGHRGITVLLLRWIAARQRLDTARTEWDLRTTVNAVKENWGIAPSSGAWGDVVLNCRAVKVNGKFSDPQKIPRAFAQVLCGGGGVVEDDATRRTLVVVGLAMPNPAPFSSSSSSSSSSAASPSPSSSSSSAPADQRKPEPQHGLQRFNVRDADVTLVVPNPLMCKYYINELKAKCALQVFVHKVDIADPLVAGANLLCRVLPKLDFATLAEQHHGGPFSPAGLAHEAAYTTCFNALVLEALPKGALANTAVPAAGVGSVDTLIRLPGGEKLEVEKLAMEAVIDRNVGNTVDAEVVMHFNRFKSGSPDGGSSYWEPRRRCLWILRRQGRDAKTSADALSTAIEQLRAGSGVAVAQGTEDVEIVGVLVSPAHTRYTVFVRPARTEVVHGPFVLPVDFVPRKLVWCGSKLELEAAQSYVSSTLDRLPPGVEVVVSDSRSTFRVTPSHPDVMSLKKAIKVERAPELDHIAADRIVIKLERDGAALGDEDDLRVGVKYFFEAPPKQ
jgi:hypothetical protein